MGGISHAIAVGCEYAQNRGMGKNALVRASSGAVTVDGRRKVIILVGKPEPRYPGKSQRLA